MRNLFLLLNKPHTEIDRILVSTSCKHMYLNGTEFDIKNKIQLF